jgi:hypothetical protein
MKRRQAWVDDNWESYEGQARELIEAMRGIGNDPGPRYAAGEYSRRNDDAMIADALSTQKGEQP